MNRMYAQSVGAEMRRFKGLQANVGGDAKASNKNTDKNRYSDVPCLDNCRVVLRGLDSDYIHANYITSKKGMKFICAQRWPLYGQPTMRYVDYGNRSLPHVWQMSLEWPSPEGPMPNTLREFWHMIIQENCRLVVMLCNVIEEDVEKSARYFPTGADTEITIGKIAINITRRSLCKFGYVDSLWAVERGSEKYNIRHLQCTTWPDHSIPAEPNGVIAIFRELLKNYSKTPILVHCGAGVGRTCAFVGSLLLMERILEREEPSAIAVVKEMRKYRYGAVQTSVQFIFMQYVIMEMFCQDGVIDTDEPKMGLFRAKYQKLLDKANSRMLSKDVMELTSDAMSVK